MSAECCEVRTRDCILNEHIDVYKLSRLGLKIESIGCPTPIFVLGSVMYECTRHCRAQLVSAWKAPRCSATHFRVHRVSIFPVSGELAA